MSAELADAVRRALARVQDPEIRRPITELDMVREVRVEGAVAHVEVRLTIVGCPAADTIERDVRAAVLAARGDWAAARPLLHKARRAYRADGRWAALLAPALALVAIACGGGEDVDPTAVTQAVALQTPNSPLVTLASLAGSGVT